MQSNKQEFYKLQHYQSFGPTKVKTGALMGEFIRIRKCCNTTLGFCQSIQCKMHELHHILGYPKKFIMSALDKISLSSGDETFGQLGRCVMHHKGITPGAWW
jgi:hypothetical protein